MYSCAGHSTPPLQLLHIAMLFVIAAETEIHFTEFFSVFTWLAGLC